MAAQMTQGLGAPVLGCFAPGVLTGWLSGALRNATLANHAVARTSAAATTVTDTKDTASPTTLRSGSFSLPTALQRATRVSAMLVLLQGRRRHQNRPASVVWRKEGGLLGENRARVENTLGWWRSGKK